MTPASPALEILAPAGSRDALEAALQAGADAVYFGLKHLNARRGAANFSPEELPEVVQRIHDAGAKAHLTLNIDIHQRELGQAARTLALAVEADVDAVLVRDPALLALRPHFPQLAFHFSTQAAVTTSAGMEAAKALGLSRVVLARELSQTEIAAAAATPGIATEVFVQGALCFSCSGRCLISSWCGGRSGNRGACASPCRVPWTNADGQTANPLSMHDLCLISHLDDLSAAGVASLKIEGRLKSPAWVAQAVSLYRHAADKTESPATLRDEADSLGEYTGRMMTNGYFTANRHDLTAPSARPATDKPHAPEPETPSQNSDSGLTITVTDDGQGATLWTFTRGNDTITHRTPRQRIANPRRAINLAAVVDNMRGLLPSSEEATLTMTPAELAEKLLPRQAGNAAVDALASFLRHSQKESDGIIRGMALPPEIAAIIAPATKPCPANCRTLGQRPDRCRLTMRQFLAIGRPTPSPYQQWVVECQPLTIADAEEQAAALLARPEFDTIAALPAVIYEEHLPAINVFLQRLQAGGRAVEINSWDAWQLVRLTDLSFEAGPGLAILNAAAARHLRQLGCLSVAVSNEIDQNQLENLSAAADTPLNITVFSHPALMLTRAELPAGFSETEAAVLTDSRNVSLRPTREGAVIALRPTQPFDWRNLRNARVKAAHLVVDLCGAESSPELTPPVATTPFLFNYDRRLR
ncbi:MAG TPA: U32 family peptidase [Lentisphaeria bacterium]|nr:U32 family peptidase [Lentisphaeria bacterium]